jgi:hypothetical protein
MTAPHPELNLLPKEPWEKGLLGQLFKWVISTGRYVVIFTELIVISAFLYRFGLDSTLTNLRQSIKQKLNIINSFGDLETNFRTVQTQLNTIKEVTDNARALTVLATLNQITPADVTYTAITINQESVSLEGRVLSHAGLATLLYQTQEKSGFSDVVLENVQSATDKSPAIEFRLMLTQPTI